MERKIGEIFEYNGKWYQAVKSQGKCVSCDFMVDGHCIIDFSWNGSCFYCHRKDGENIIFKKLEKVGEPYKGEDKIFQPYQAYIIPIPKWDYKFSMLLHQETKIIDIEIKQTKEDMEKNKLNLKPFDIQKAKAGKPVCTRNGRRARIICFDAKGKQPIIALFEKEKADEEVIQTYNADGSYYGFGKEDCRDLMMLPEKKEGWVNIDKGGSGKITISSPYSTKEEAIHNDNECTIDTIKISWEE